MGHEQAADHHEEHPPTTIRQYIVIGVVLAVITVLELSLTEALDLPFATLVASLVFLSAIKFAIVVALFMHLRFDHPLFTRLFVFGLALASALLVALLFLFGAEQTNAEDRVAIPGGADPSSLVEPAGHGEDGDEGEHGEGEGGAEGEAGAEGLVAGVPAAEFFSTNCAACHGQNREGLVGPALTPATLGESDDFYQATIRDGRPGTAMPPWGGMLNDADIAAMVHFLKTTEP